MVGIPLRITLLAGSMALVLTSCRPLVSPTGSGEGEITVTAPTQVQQEKTEMANKVTAEVILRTADGKSILDATEGVTATTIAEYRVGKDVLDEVSRKLVALGFKVEQTSSVGLTISGSKDLFEEVFQTTLEARTKSVMPPEVTAAERSYFRAAKPIQIPADLTSLIADVVLPIPPEYFP